MLAAQRNLERLNGRVINGLVRLLLLERESLTAVRQLRMKEKEISREEVLDVLFASIGELNQQRSAEQQLECALDTQLGEKAGLDSLAYVNLLALVEDECQERFGTSVALFGVPLDPGARDPFESVETLAEYVQSRLMGLAPWR
jgi:acyl carrier protein